MVKSSYALGFSREAIVIGERQEWKSRCNFSTLAVSYKMVRNLPVSSCLPEA